MFCLGFEKVAGRAEILANIAKSKAAREASKNGVKGLSEAAKGGAKGFAEAAKNRMKGFAGGSAKITKPTSVAKATSAIRAEAKGTDSAVDAGFKAQRVERGASTSAGRSNTFHPDEVARFQKARGGAPKAAPSAGPKAAKPVGVPKPAGAPDQPWHAQATDWVKKNPLKSAGIAGGAGLVAGAALGGRSNNQQQR